MCSLFSFGKWHNEVKQNLKTKKQEFYRIFSSTFSWWKMYPPPPNTYMKSQKIAMNICTFPKILKIQKKPKHRDDKLKQKKSSCFPQKY